MKYPLASSYGDQKTNRPWDDLVSCSKVDVLGACLGSEQNF